MQNLSRESLCRENRNLRVMLVSGVLHALAARHPPEICRLSQLLYRVQQEWGCQAPDRAGAIGSTVSNRGLEKGTKLPGPRSRWSDWKQGFYFAEHYPKRLPSPRSRWSDWKLQDRGPYAQRFYELPGLRSRWSDCKSQAQDAFIGQFDRCTALDRAGAIGRRLKRDVFPMRGLVAQQQIALKRL
jgi:hypothetical protein